MTQDQRKASVKLCKALQACHDSGLMGGVFDCTFYVWPVGPVHPADGPGKEPFDFFNNIRALGGIGIGTGMNLDGGAGV